MKTNASGRSLIKESEGLRLKAYLCPAGIPTIGYGHTGDVKLGQQITEHQADVLLQYDLERFEEDVAHATRAIKLTENQFSALVSFAYNLGIQALLGSGLLRHLLAGRVSEAADAFLLWNKARVNGVLTVLPGLEKRRAAERELFLRAPGC
jgi:lysozyme